MRPVTHFPQLLSEWAVREGWDDEIRIREEQTRAEATHAPLAQAHTNVREWAWSERSACQALFLQQQAEARSMCARVHEELMARQRPRMTIH